MGKSGDGGMRDAKVNGQLRGQAGKPGLRRLRSDQMKATSNSTAQQHSPARQTPRDRSPSLLRAVKSISGLEVKVGVDVWEVLQ